jgi:hypothetical protein
VANIAAAINYIKSRYGSIFAIDPPVQGYGSGGTVGRTGLGWLHQGEEVLANGPAQAVRAARASASSGGGDTYVINVNVAGNVTSERNLVTAVRAGIRDQLRSEGKTATVI